MKILIGLIEHFGDVVACEPVARYLRYQYPDAHIAWAIQKPYRELIDSNPHINETILLGCLTDWIKLQKHNKRKQDFDLVVDLHVNLRVCEDCRIPLVKEYGNPFVNAYEWFDHGALLEALSVGAGLPKLTANPQVYLNESQGAAVDALKLPPDFFVIHRESNSVLKDWTDDKWLGLVSFVVKELKVPVVEVGKAKPEGQKDSPAFDSLVINLIDKTSLLETAEVIRRARLYIGIDSGPAHLANAVRTPGIVLLGPMGFFRQYIPFTGLYGGNSPLGRIIRTLDGVVADIPLEEVLQATKQLVNTLDHLDVRPKVMGPAPLDPPSDEYRRMVMESGLFDRPWYITHFPEFLDSGLDPLDYFLTIGTQADQSPSEAFNTKWYKTQRPDLAAAHDPLQHYLFFGKAEGLSPRLYTGSTVAEAPPSVEHVVGTLDSLTNPLYVEHRFVKHESVPKIFAFYLPQFHPIAENNYGHRPGFTEWDNVIKSKPLFKGHYQPRIPGELGYYDLRSVDVMREQVKLANEHGIDGFCFYYYYFQGKKLLYKPIENYIKSDLKAPFFFLWANENWSRRWDGGDNEVIVSQSHSAEDDLGFIWELMPTFADERYHKVNGKPIIGIYKAHLFPDIKGSIETWRREAQRHGFPDLYLVMVDDWTADPVHPRKLGFDASYEIPSNIVPEEVLIQDQTQLGLKKGFEGRVVDYRKFAAFHMSRPFPDHKRFRTVMAPWDNTPRYASRAMVHVNTDNDSYAKWLSEALIDTRRRYAPEEQIVFLHSWNEWCEGTYVEPDGRFGRRLLEETKRVVEELGNMALVDDDQEHLKMAVYLRRLMFAKDEGVSRSLQALRQQNMYTYRELEHQRSQRTQLAAEIEKQSLVQAQQRGVTEAATQTAARATQEAHAAHAVLQSVVRSKSWRATEPFRALARILKRP